MGVQTTDDVTFNVRFDVVVVEDGNEKQKRLDFTFTSALFPDGSADENLHRTGSSLVKVWRKNSPGGIVEGVLNWKQVKASVAFFEDKHVGYVNTIVTSLAHNGAHAAIVKVRPTARVQIPVFVLDDNQFREVANLNCKTTSVSFKPIDDGDFEDNEVTHPLSTTKDDGLNGRKSGGGDSYWKRFKRGMKALVSAPEVRAKLKKLMHEDCNWFPSPGNLDSFHEAMNLFKTSKASDDSETEINEVLKQTIEHMKRSDYKIDIVLMAFAAALLRELPHQHNNFSDLNRSIENCFDKLEVIVSGPKLCNVLDHTMYDASVANPCKLLLVYTASYLNRMKKEDAKEKDRIAMNLVWIEVFHCGKPYEWKKFVGFISAASFSSLSPSMSTIRSITDLQSFRSLGLFSQSTILHSCNFINDEMARTVKDDGRSAPPPFIVEPSHGHVKQWMRTICLSEVQDDASCRHFMQSLSVLEFSNQNKEKKREVIEAFAESICAKKISRLELLCVDVEHSDRDICDHVIVAILQSKLRSHHRNQRNSLSVSDFESLMGSRIGTKLGSLHLFDCMRGFVLSKMSGYHPMMKVKVRLLDTTYKKLIELGDVQYDLIRTFVMVAFETALDSHSMPTTQYSKNAPQEIFDSACQNEDIFTSGQGDLLEPIAKLVVQKYIDITSLPTNTKYLLKLPLSRKRDDKTLIACLSRQLASSLCTIYNDIEEVSDLYGLLCDDAAPGLEHILEMIVLASIESWNPCRAMDIFSLKPSCLTLLSAFSTDKRGLQSIQSKFDGLKYLFADWQSNKEVSTLPIREIKKLRGQYEISKWEAIGSLIGEDLITVSSLDSGLRRFEELVSSIKSNFYLPSSYDRNKNAEAGVSILDIFRRYECNVENTTGYAHLLNNCIVLLELLLDTGSKHSHSICSAQKLSDDLAHFREQFDTHIKTAAYFLNVDCKLFTKHIGNSDSIGVEEFLKNIENTQKLLQKLLRCEGCGILSIIHENVQLFSEPGGQSIINRDKLKYDVSLLISCPTFDVDESQRQMFIILFSLDSIKIPLEGFIHCCKQLKFRFAAEDDDFKTLENILMKLESSDDSEQHFIFYKDIASNLVHIFKGENIEFTLDELAECMSIFRTIAESSDVWTFVREMKWFGKDGLQQFYSEFGNTTNKLLFATYESSVLDSLQPTVRFLSHVGSLCEERRMIVFIQSLMNAFNYDLKTRMRRKEVYQIVQQNISNIREWFDNGVDDMTAIFSRFDAAWSTGKYAFDEGRLCLLYAHENRKIRLSGTQLDNFIQQLGFVQHDNENVSCHIASFLDQAEILRKVITSQVAVIEAGYSNNDLDQFCYKVNQDLAAAIDVLKESNQLSRECDAWKTMIRKSYPMSILFWNNDLRSLYNAITSVQNNDSAIASALSNLIPHNCIPSARPHVIQISQECLRRMENKFLDKSKAWVEVISAFIELFYQVFFERVDCPKPNRLGGQSGITLHFLDCDEEVKEYLALGVISNVYKDRLPESFEILDGFCSPSLADLMLFLDRVASFPDSTFMLINVQALPANLQERVVHFTSSSEAASNTYNLHCLQFSETILHSSPWIEDVVWDTNNCIESFFGNVVDDINIEDIRIVTSASCGAGKSRRINNIISGLDQLRSTVSICIHEGTTLDSLVSELKNHGSHDTGRNAIHFSFMLPLERCDPNLIKSLNHFFNHLLLSRSVQSPINGETFFMGWSKWCIYVEIPNIGSSDVETMNALRRYLPILSICSIIEIPSQDFAIGDKSRRVCTYLRAFSDGTINRKFKKKTNKHLFFVIDDSGSMGLTLDDGRSAFEVAVANALKIFDGHINVGDCFGTIIFSSMYRVAVPIQMIQDDAHKHQIRDQLARSSFIGGGTQMYLALNQALIELGRLGMSDNPSWIVCLTDGESDHSQWECFRQALLKSPRHLHLMVVGVNLKPNYENHLRDLCSKFGNDIHGAFIPSRANVDAMNQAFGQVGASLPVSETFTLDGLLSDKDCQNLMKKYLPDTINNDDMVSRKFWIEFLYRRVKVFDENEHFNYNQSYENLGGSLMLIMLHEAEQLLSKKHNMSWKETNHEQLIYDFTDQDKPQFRLICTAPELMSVDSIQRYESLDLPGFFIPKTAQLRQRTTLDRFLSQALGIPLTRDKYGHQRLSCIDENRFVLTLDFVMKLLNIHERVACHIPCVIEGETGVSKTALTKMYSILRNASLNEKAKVDTDIALALVVNTLRDSNLVDYSNNEESLKIIQDALRTEADGNLSRRTEVGSRVQELLLQSCERRSSIFQKVPDKFKSNLSGETNAVLDMLNWFVQCDQEETFFELNIDASLTEVHIKSFFNEVSKTAQRLAQSKALIVVFLDEVNTSSIIGLFKEIIVDHSICGRVIEDNIVIVAACNPSGRQALSSNCSRECEKVRDCISGHYQVNELPASIACLKWEYGALNADQEKEFILRRMEMMDSNIPKLLQTEVTELVAQSQEMIRSFAVDAIEKRLRRQYGTYKGVREEAEARARSAVSLRDIQRVFSLFYFFSVEFPMTSGQGAAQYRNSIYLTIAVVYYLRLSHECRNLFVRKISWNDFGSDAFLTILDEKMTEIALETKIPDGIALTDGLKENLFMTLVCSLSLTPLVIVGPPGSSKTLSVNIIDDNTNGEESPTLHYRQLSRLHTYHYQCSKTSTSDEVASVFEMAKQRQKTLDSTKHKCLVFMDEAGLPEEEKESLKVLHYYLEGHMTTKAEVGFVAITNMALDAAKSNRCVSLLRQDPSDKEMLQIAQGVLYNRNRDTKAVFFFGKNLSMGGFAQSLCSAYKAVVSMDDFENFFGLRDFIYFLKSINERSQYVGQNIKITVEAVIRSLERNFNGKCRDDFEKLVHIFLLECSEKAYAPCNLETLLRMPLEVVSEALSASNASNARYTLIIDESKDDAIMRILNNERLLSTSKKSLFKLSNLGETSELEGLSLVSGVKFAASQGFKVVLSQTDSVNESFYDLFNQHFRRVRNRDGNEDLFANIAVGGISRRSLVSSEFRCVLHTKAEDLPQMPAPFLNRFEKYRLSLKSVLSSKLDESPFLKRILVQVRKQVDSFTDTVKICGFVSGQTTESIFIDMLTSTEYAQNRKEVDDTANASTNEYNLRSFSDHFVAFAIEYLHCDLSSEDFDSITKSCSKFLPLPESEALAELLEKTELMCANEVFEECLGSKPPSNIVSRVIEMLSEATITRHAIFQLLELATPEEIFAKRNTLPFDIVSQYFQQQHFGIKPFLQTMKSRPLLHLEKFIIHTRSDIDLLRIPTLRQDEQNFEIVRKLVQEDVKSIMIEHLHLVKTESSLRSLLESWVENTNINTFLLIVNMSSQAAVERVNFVRCCIDQLPAKCQKRLLMILHYPPSTFLSNSFYPVLFLGRWRHIYLNNTCRNGISNGLKHVIEKACIGVHDHNSHSSIHVQEMTDEIMTDVVKSLASQEIFYPEQIPPSAGFHQKYKMLLSILDYSVNKCTIRSILSNKFCELWTEKNLTTVLRRASWSLKKGTSQLGLVRCLQSVIQDAMRTFFLDYLLRLNEWRNFDLLLHSSGHCDPAVESLFFTILDQIPSLPFDELVLHQVDTTRKLRELPMSSKLDVKFPFFSLITKLLDEIVDCALMKYGDENNVIALEVKDILEYSMVLLRENSVDQMYSGIILKIVETVSSQEIGEKDISLFQIYLDQFLTWKLCCDLNSLPSKWFIDKLHRDEAISGNLSSKNLVTIHIAAKKYEMSLIRLSSMNGGAFWSDLTYEFHQTGRIKSDLPLPGLELVTLLCSWFRSNLSQLTDENAYSWMEKFSIFYRTLSDIIGDQKVACNRTCAMMRVMTFFYVLKKNTVQASTCINCINLFTADGGEFQYDIDTSMAYLVKLIVESDEVNANKYQCIKALAKALFSPQMLSYIDLHWESDLAFVLTDLKLLDILNDNDVVTLLRNACIYGEMEDKKFSDVTCLSPSRLAVINSHLSCSGLSIFATDGRRLNIPRFIPAFATRADDNLVDREDLASRMKPTSNIESFFLNNTKSFSSKLAIAEATFQIMLEDTLNRCSGKSSEQILLMFLKNLEMESSLTRQEQTRSRRIQTNGARSTNVGTPIGILILESCLICYLFKVSHELAKERTVFALEGAYAEYAWSVLNCAMSARGSRLQEIFMLNIVRLGGQSKLRDLVRKGGSLFGLKWTREWSGGLPEARGDIDDVVNKAEAELHETFQEEQRKAREIRLCPHCAQPFQILARNCGHFICGRADTHTTPMNGGGLGCGQAFRDSEARYYIQDDALLARLQQNVFNAHIQAHTHNEMSMVWEELDSAELPYLSSRLGGDSSIKSFYPLSVALEAIGNGFDSIRHLVYSREKVNSFLMLPDLIELYLWLHSTFQFIILPEQATSKTFGDIMKEDVLLKRFDQTHTNHVINLYQRVKSSLNLHLKQCNYEVNWDCETLSVPIQNLDDASLIMLLSAYDHPTDGYDYLFIIINQIVLQYNEFVLKLHGLQNKTVTPQMLLHRSPAGLALKSMTFLTSSELPLMVESHRRTGKNEYNFQRLEKQLLEKLSACNFCIEIPLQYLRAKFQFRTTIDLEFSAKNQALAGIKSSSGVYFVHQQDLQLLESCLQIARRRDVNTSHEMESTFLSKFHGLEYEELRKMLGGLRNILQTSKSNDWKVLQDLLPGSNEHINDDMEEFGFPSLSTSQLSLAFICALRPNQILELILFMGYQMATESYSFATLPLSMKSTIPIAIKETFKKNLSSLVNNQGYEQTIQLLNEFKNDILSFYQSFIRDHCSKSSSNDCLKVFLQDNNLCDNSDLIFKAIPNQITVRNFVSLCQEIHQLTLFFMSNEYKHDFVNDEAIDVYSPYTSPKRGNCWLYHSRQDEDSKDSSASIIDEDYEEHSVESDTNASEQEGMWFGAADVACCEDHVDKNDDEILSQPHSAVEELTDKHDEPASITSVSSIASFTVSVDDTNNPFEERMNYSANMIQIWWRLIKLKELETVESSNMENQDTSIRGASGANQTTLSFTDTNLDDQQVLEKESRYKTLLGISSMSSARLFWIFIAAHLMFKVVESILS